MQLFCDSCGFGLVASDKVSVRRCRVTSKLARRVVADTTSPADEYGNEARTQALEVGVVGADMGEGDALRALG